jgi:Nucleotidyl transferase AbiEii toxin, Type IV TA system
MHLQVLNKDQIDLLPVMHKFNKEFYMVGGTSIALHLGHRLSIDFDMFKTGKIKPKAIVTIFEKMKEDFKVTLNIPGQLNLLCRDVKITFFDFDFEIPHPVIIKKFTSIPTLLDLAAMKAYALGHRSKWKDYLDLYFILQNNFTITQISDRATELFSGLFSEKLFRAQLCYFKGINFDEQVEFLPGFQTDEQTIKDYLIECALS